MKLKDLSQVLYSTRGNVQLAIVYDQEQNRDIEYGCTIDHAVKTYGDRDLKLIEAIDNKLLITL